MRGARRAHLILSGAPLNIDPIRMQYARARPNFWSARRSALNFLVRAVAMLCRLGFGKFLFSSLLMLVKS